MKVDDLILVSIDDHVVEPPDMFDRHVAGEVPRPGAARRDGRRRHRAVAVRGPADRVDGPERGRQLAQGGVGLRPHRLRRDAPGRVRHPRARPRHEPQRHPRVDVLPDLRRVQRRHVPGGAPTRTSRWPCVQAYNDWHIDEWCAAYPGPLHPARHPADLGPASSSPTRCDRVAAKGCRAITMPELPHIQGLPELPSTSTTGTRSSTRCRDEQVVMCLHIGQGFDAINTPPEAPIDNLIILATQVSALAAQDLLWGGAFRNYPDLKVAWSEAGIGWIPFFLDRCDRHYTQPALAGSRLRRQDAERHLPRALARVLRHRPRRRSRCATTSASTSSPGSATTRTPTRSGPTRPRSCCASWTAPVRPTTTSTRSPGRTRAGTSATTRSSTSPRSRATVGALRAQSPDVDITTRSRAEWRERYEAAHAS